MSKHKHLGPLKSIRKYCMWCCIDQIIEVRLCPSENCQLHPYRFGYVPDPKPKKTVLRSIRERCLECVHFEINTSCENNHPDPKNLNHCYLWIYRKGHNPSRKGLGRIGGNPSFKRNNLQSHVPIRDQEYD